MVKIKWERKINCVKDVAQSTITGVRK